MATDLSAGVAYIDDRFMPIAEASVPILDLGFLRSDATYDVVAVWNGRFFRLDGTSTGSSREPRSCAWSCRSTAMG